MIRKLMALGALMCGLVGSAQAAERLAMGLIVKLKNSQPASVVQLRATLRPQELPSQTRLRMSAAAQRHGVSFLVQRPTAFGAQLIHNGGVTRWAEAEAQARVLRQDPDVEWVVVNEIARPHALSSNDPGYLSGEQTWMQDAATGAIPNIPAAFQRLATLGRALDPVVVAVLDTGVLRHPDLEGRVLFSQGYDFVTDRAYSNDGDGLDPDATDPGDYLSSSTIRTSKSLYGDCTADSSTWHGTMTAGVLGAAMNNGRGFIGLLSPLGNTPVLPVRVAGNCGASTSDILEGMLWAAGINYNGSPSTNPNPARVVSLSFGGAPGCACTSGNEDACLYRDAIQALRSKGAILVASSGNGDGASTGGAEATRPASCPGALAVTALNINGVKADYANLVTASGVATMGGDPHNNDEGIYTTINTGTQGPTLQDGVPEDSYRRVAGTSFSAPIAAGTVALMWAVNPGLTVDQILNGLRSSGVRAHVSSGWGVCSSSNTGSCTCDTNTCGAGILDVDKAVAWAAAQPYGSYTATDVTATFFTPARLASSSRSSGGGGGGALDGRDLMALVLSLLLALGWRVRQHLSARRRSTVLARHEALARR